MDIIDKIKELADFIDEKNNKTLFYNNYNDYCFI